MKEKHTINPALLSVWNFPARIPTERIQNINELED
jgi:hypothetical protein